MAPINNPPHQPQNPNPQDQPSASLEIPTNIQQAFPANPRNLPSPQTTATGTGGGPSQSQTPPSNSIAPSDQNIQQAFPANPQNLPSQQTAATGTGGGLSQSQTPPPNAIPPSDQNRAPRTQEGVIRPKNQDPGVADAFPPPQARPQQPHAENPSQAGVADAIPPNPQQQRHPPTENPNQANPTRVDNVGNIFVPNPRVIPSSVPVPPTTSTDQTNQTNEPNESQSNTPPENKNTKKKGPNSKKR